MTANTSQAGAAGAELPFDPDALREKYRQERDKRLRADGNNQYREVVGEFSHYVDDPYIAEEIQREPLTDEVDVAIIGAIAVTLTWSLTPATSSRASSVRTVDRLTTTAARSNGAKPASSAVTA